MKAPCQTYVMCLFFRHLDYFVAILATKWILYITGHGPVRARKYVVVWHKWVGPGSFMLAPGGLGCKIYFHR